MTQDTDELGWTLPTPGDETEAGEWAQILVDAIDDEIERDVVQAQQSQTSVQHANTADEAAVAGAITFGDGIEREMQINGRDESGVVNFKTNG